MKFWEKFSSFDKANLAWDNKKDNLEKKLPLKKALFDPKIKTIFSYSYRIKSFFYIIKQDKNHKIFKFFLKKPFFYLFNLLKSYFSKKPYKLQKDIFLHNLNNLKELKKIALNKKSLFIFGFSYCQKPLECPKKRFSSECIFDYKNDICLQCFIGKCANALNKKDVFLVIPHINFIGEKLFEILNKNPKEQIIFIITSCELSIKMFSDFANMLKIKGLGLKLTKRICPNFTSFLYAEKGKKSGLTDLNNENKNLLIEILKLRYKLKNP